VPIAVSYRKRNYFRQNVEEYVQAIKLWADIFTLTTMENDLIPFLIGVGLLVGYLCFSAATEMGTKLPWKK